MNKIELERRTKEFSLQLIRFLESLPKNYLGETLYWLELMLEAGIGANQEAIRLMQESKQLLAIFTAAGRTSKENR